MIFQNPDWYLLFLSIPLALLIYISGRRFWKGVCFRRDGGAALQQQVNGETFRRYLRLALALAALFFMVLALMRPRWGARAGGETELGIDIAILLDISRSMAVSDVMPSRLERTVSELEVLLQELEGNRFALVLFAGAAYIQCPLTTDIGAIREFLENASPALIGLQGTNIEDGFEKVVRVLTSQFKRNRVVLLVSDGENHEGDARARARSLYRDHSIRIFTVGVGTAEGARVSAEAGSEQIIISKLDETTLKDIAAEGGGEYYRIGDERFDVTRLATSINSIEKTGMLLQRPDTLVERYPLFAGTALLLWTLALVIPERRQR